MEQLTIGEKCRLAEVSRAGFYRHRQEKAPDEEELALRDKLQELVAANHQRLGYRPLTHLLRQEGWRVNHKRVLRLMREDNLLSLLRKKYVITTDSRHDNYVYRNLVPDLKLTGINQLWVSDITYIRLKKETVFLAIVMDAYSRRIIGWELRRTMQAELPLAALQQALRERQWKCGQLIHHSDRGVQYTSHVYTELLEKHGIAISMSRTGNPYDNARAERFMRTLKQEEVYLTEYQNLEEARARIGEFLANVYNRRRLHSALGYLTPEAFEAAQATTDDTSVAPAAAVTAGAVEADGADGNHGKPQSRFPTVSHSSLEIPLGFPPLPPPDDDGLLIIKENNTNRLSPIFPAPPLSQLRGSPQAFTPPIENPCPSV